MGYIGNLGGYLYPISSDYFWSQRTPGQIRFDWMDYYLSRYLIGPTISHRYGASLGEITLFEHKDFGGASKTFTSSVPNLTDYGFNDKTSSFKVKYGKWYLCSDKNYTGSKEKNCWGPFTAGLYNLHTKDYMNDEWPNDAISSIFLYNDNGYVSRTNWNEVYNRIVAHYKAHGNCVSGSQISPCVDALIKKYIEYMKNGNFEEFGLFNLNGNIYRTITFAPSNFDFTSYFTEIISMFVNEIAIERCKEKCVTTGIGTHMDEGAAHVKTITGSTSIDVTKPLDSQKNIPIPPGYVPPIAPSNNKCPPGYKLSAQICIPEKSNPIKSTPISNFSNFSNLYIGIGVLSLAVVAVMITSVVLIKKKVGKS